MRSVIIGGLGLLLVGCGADAPADVEPATFEARHEALSTDEGLPPPGGTNAACPGTRWVGVLPASLAACPAAVDAQWSAGPLFDGGAAPFDRYCLYEWSGQGPAPSGRPALAQAENAWLEADCHAVGAQSPTRDVLWPQLHAAHRRQTGAVAPLPAGAGARSVRVAVADSAVHAYDLGNPSHGQLEHGRAVSLVARQFACPPEGGPCNAFVANHLALPRDADGTANAADGGFYGFQSELALAIFNAVGDWQAQLGTPFAQERLVVNLSVGWSPAYGGAYAGDDPSSLRPGVRAVHDAIRWARCNGALVVAAAGNATFGPSPETGPLFPARWEGKRAPNAQECAAMGDVVAPPGRPAFAAAPYDALLFAASGLDYRDRPLHNARPASRTRVAAPAFLVVGADPDPTGSGTPGPPQPTQAYTGSSMAAAAVSGVAASVWAYAPDLAPAQVIDLLHQTGVVLGGVPADFCNAGTCGDVRRVSQCRAIERLCTDRPTVCGFVPDCAPIHVPAFAGTGPFVDPNPDADGDGVADLDAALPSAPIAASGRLTLDTPGCAGQPLFYTPDPHTGSPAPPPVTCPQETLPVGGAAPWVGPQPDNDPCDICYVYGSDLYINISTALDSAVTLQDATLTRYDGYGNVIDSLRLDTLDSKMDPLLPGEYVRISGLPAPGFRTVRSATMSYMNGSKPYSYVSAVPVY